MDLGAEFIETDEAGRILVNYAGPSGTFAHYSAFDVISGKVPKDALEGKAVLIGANRMDSGSRRMVL